MTGDPMTGDPMTGDRMTGAAPTSLPPDPEAYDSPRAVQARARGLSAPYIEGGLDPDLEATERQERRYVRLLIGMIVVVVLSGFVIGIVAKLLGFDFLLGTP